MALKNKKSKGFYVIEAIVAILVFMIGIVGMVKLQTNSIQAVSDAQFRINASYLGESIIAQMWANKPNISAYASGSGDGYTEWLTELKASMPGVDAHPPVITVVPNASGGFAVTVTITWKNPSNGTLATYVSQSTIF